MNLAKSTDINILFPSIFSYQTSLNIKRSTYMVVCLSINLNNN